MCAAALPLALFAGPAFGQPSSDAAVAQALFDEGRRLMTAGQYAAACPKFSESFRLDASLGTLLNLAVCYESAGQLASAWSHFRDAVFLARREGRSDREKFADEHVRKLEPRLSHLTIVVPSAVDSPGLTIRLDGTPVGRPARGLPLPVDD